MHLWNREISSCSPDSYRQCPGVRIHLAVPGHAARREKNFMFRSCKSPLCCDLYAFDPAAAASALASCSKLGVLPLTSTQLHCTLRTFKDLNNPCCMLLDMHISIHGHCGCPPAVLREMCAFSLSACMITPFIPLTWFGSKATIA